MTPPPDTAQDRRRLVSIIAPAFNEADNVAGLVEFHREMRRAHPDLDFELIVVDDGSADETSRLALAALDGGDVARIATLSRNFGSHAAVSAGLALARGDCAITVSTDLQEPLSLITEFLDHWRGGSDIVWGLRTVRKVPPGVANWMSRTFSKAFHRLSDSPMYPKEGPSQVLVGRPVIDAFNAMPERNRNVMGMLAWIGFTQSSVWFEQLPRPAGTSKWTTGKKIRLVVDSFVEFSAAPFLITFLLGLGISLLGVLGTLVTLVVALFAATPIGWPLVLCTVLVLGGMNLSALGGFGEYLWRTGDDARRRPVYVVRGVHDVGSPTAAAPVMAGAAVATDPTRNGAR